MSLEDPTIDPGLHLPDRDEEYLASKGFSWTLRRDGAGVWLIIFDLKIDSARFTLQRGPDPAASPPPAGDDGSEPDPMRDWAGVTSDDGVVLLINIPPQYPQVKLDMFWVWPHVKDRHTGKYPDRAEVFEQHLGRSVQRFSRHLQTWRPGIDGLAGYLALVQNILRPR